MKRKIYCCECKADVQAELTDGTEVYAHRPDLANLPFWKCPQCKNFVGCHHKTADRTRPLGVIPNRAMKRARNEIHNILDPIWKRGKMSRKLVYNHVAEALGISEYHTAELRTIEDARLAYKAVVKIRKSVGLTRKQR